MTSHYPIIVAPSLLAASFGSLKDEIHSVEQGGADWLHVDVMDGSFVPPITFGANAVELAKNSAALPLDVHLMIVHPDLHIESFRDAGASVLTVHQETCPHLHRTLQAIRSAGMKAGACVNPATPVSSLFDVLDLCDLVLIMTVNPGWGGQEFLPSCVKKVVTLRDEIKRRGLSTLIEVDGGINPETARQCVQAGANVLVSGSYIFSSQNRAQAIQSLRV